MQLEASILSADRPRAGGCRWPAVWTPQCRVGLWATAPTKLAQSWESGPTFNGAEHTADTARRQQNSITPKTSPEAERAANESGPPLSSFPKLPQLPLLRRLSQCCRSIPEFRGLLLSITACLLSGPGRDFSVTHNTRSYLVLSFLRRVSPGDTPYLCYKHESPGCLPN